MKNAGLDGIPQVISVVPVSREGKFSLKKNVRSYLGASNGILYINAGKEILITTEKSGIQAEIQAIASVCRRKC